MNKVCSHRVAPRKTLYSNVIASGHYSVISKLSLEKGKELGYFGSQLPVADSILAHDVRLKMFL